MSNMIADLFVRLSAVTKPYTEAMVSASAQGEAFAEANNAQADAIKASNGEAASSYGLIGKAAAGLTAGFTAVSAVSVEWATQFQTAMTRLYTQTGLTNTEIQAAGYTTQSLQNKVLALGTQTGYSGTQMAQALYYPLSASFNLSTALDIVGQAARGAQISGASLSDTTDALSAVMRSLYSDTNNVGDATTSASTVMAELNAIVGQGKMTFQDLDSSVKNWAPAASTFGVSLSSVGAALDFMVDRGDSATTAGTRVAMVMSMLGGQTSQAASYMKDLGLTSTEQTAATQAMSQALADSGLSVSRLAADMKKPDGIEAALEDLHTAMTKNGISAQAQSAILEKVFGGSRSFRGAAELYDNLSGIQQKFQQINAQSNQQTWADAWTKTTNTLKFQLDKLGASVKNAGISFGMWLIPKVTEAISKLEKLGTTKVMPVVHELGSIFQQIGAGFDGTSGPGSGSGGSPVNTTGRPGPRPGNNADTSGGAPSSPWAQVGRVLREVDTDFTKFATDVASAAPKLADAFKGVASFAGGALLAGLQALGGLLANVVGPAIKDVANFLDQHKAAVTFFVDVLLAGMAARLLAIKSIDATTGLVNLTNKILSFPFSQMSQISDAFKGLKTAWLGEEVDAGTVGGLKNTLGYLKQQFGSLWRGIKGPDFAKMLGDGFKGAGAMMRQQWTVLTGMASQGATKIGQALTSLPDKIGSAMWTGAFKAEQAFNAIKRKAFSAMDGAQQAFAEFPGKVSGAIDDFGARIAVGMQKAQDLASDAGDFIANKWGLVWSHVSGAVSDGMDFVESKVGSAAEKIGGGFTKLGSLARSGLSSLAEGALSAANATWGLVTSMAAASASALKNAGAFLIDKAAEIGSAIAAKATAAAEWLLNIAMDANPVMLIITAILALIGIFVLLWTKCSWFRDFWKALWKDISKLIGDAVSWIKSHLMLIVQVILGPVIDGILFLSHHWSQIWSDIQSVAGAAWNWVYGNVIHPIVSAFDWVGSVVGGFASWWGQVWGGIGDALSGLYNNVIRPIFGAIQSGINSVTSGFNAVSGFVGKVGSFFGFEDGGFVPGPPGQAMLAVVHGGEYVLSRDMLTGRAPVDNRAMTGILNPARAGGGGRGTAVMSGFAVGAGAGAGASSTTVIAPTVIVQGPTLSTDDAIQAAVIQAMQRFGLRNGFTYQPYSRSRGS